MVEDFEVVDAWVPAHAEVVSRVQRQLSGLLSRPLLAPRPPPPLAATFHSSAPAPPRPRHQRLVPSASVPRPTCSPIQVALAASAPPPPPPPPPRHFTESTRPPQRPPSPAHADADHHGVGVDRAAKAPRCSERVTAPGTVWYCTAPGCQREREAEGCQLCVLCCQWEWCSVHCDLPRKCRFRGCQHQAPRIRPDGSLPQCPWRFCRRHCPDPDRCAYHSLPARQSTNRTRGARSAAAWAQRQTAAAADDADGHWRW